LRLESEEIRSVLADEATVGMNWLLGNAVRGVKVLVADEDFSRAAAILAEDAASLAGFAGRRSPDWTCRLCGEEVTGDFEVCWSCGASRDGAADPHFEKDADAEPTDLAALAKDSSERASLDPANLAEFQTVAKGYDEPNPFRPPLAPLGSEAVAARAPQEEAEFSADDETVYRAWKASITGLAFCPPALQLYSTALLLSLAFNERPLGPKASRRYVVAWVINIAAVSLAGAEIVWLLR
jgi:hypothetical protein